MARFTEMGHSFEMTMPRGSNAFNTSLEIVKDRKFPEFLFFWYVKENDQQKQDDGSLSGKCVVGYSTYS